MPPPPGGFRPPPGPPGGPGGMMPPPGGPGGMMPPPGGPGGFAPPGGMGMGMGMGARPRPTKDAIVPVRKLQNFNWRRILVLPSGAPNKKESIWDDVKEFPLS